VQRGTNLQMTVDTISISDGIFYNSVDSYLAKGGVFEVAFQDWQSFPSTTTSWSSTATFQANGGSINAVVAFWTNANADQTLDTVTGTSNYFTRIGGDNTNATGGGITNYQTYIMGTFYPQYPAIPQYGFQDLMNFWGHTHDQVGGVCPKMYSLNTFSAYLQHYFMIGVKLNDPDSTEAWLTGLNTQNQNAPGYVKTNGVAGSTAITATAHVYVQKTCVLLIGMNQQVRLIP